ncbi:L-gulonolactone oxidase 3 [Datura stramonium]|uniref:L-gulonolactone oxidase 3 n=1 Tax=Datura stramonium TaxID=4076 RepID=A0ABS8UVM5_DATST|nr:L-gulonolactone oxidase 3 [Datura stramonium]
MEKTYGHRGCWSWTPEAYRYDSKRRVEFGGCSLLGGRTVAGLISTGAHGSSWWGRGGAVHDHVIGLSLIVAAREFEGYAKIVRLTPQDPLFNAATVSLGLLGIISKVTFQLEPAFKRSVRLNFTNDSDIEEEFMEHARKNEFGDIQ